MNYTTTKPGAFQDRRSLAKACAAIVLCVAVELAIAGAILSLTVAIIKAVSK